MKLEIEASWDGKVPYEERNRLEYRDGILIRVGVEGVSPLTGLKREYRGALTTYRSADGYMALLINDFFGDDSGLLECEWVGDDKISGVRLKPARYDVNVSGRRAIVLEAEKPKAPIGIRTGLERLEAKWFLEPRNETVSDCDYWDGFFGTSSNFWTGSVYPAGNPDEIARQLAFELERGIRDTSNEGWYFPGQICLDDDASPAKERVVERMNQILRESRKRDKDKVIRDLRELAAVFKGD